ncbi:MAG: glutathione S-transferase C-terminal domain-containing protein [Acidipropionibacterium sp.]|jgi:putative glutathione S-transferase|nr:glutathione S-transferase C-terminal domain-containing protein [Acidipropionibacterium sp.]
MSSVVTELEAERPKTHEPVRTHPEITAEQTSDGAFKRQPNRFTARFSTGELPVEKDRYRLVVSAESGWSRRQIIVRRLLGLDGVISIAYVSGRGPDGGWVFADQPGGRDPVLGFRRLNDAYRTAEPGYRGRGTVPALVDIRTGAVVTNDYHTLSLELETAWKPFHAAGAPDLYPEALRPQIDLLNQQLFDDVDNGPYKVLFATSPEAGAAAKGVFEARLRDYDHRLATRRYLFGERLTDSDIRLFSTLASFDQTYVTGYPEELRSNALRVRDLPNLWAYLRDLFTTPGFVDERDTEALGITPRPDGSYLGGFGEPVLAADDPNRIGTWQQAAGRDHLTGSPEASGPGGAGTDTLWSFKF